MFFQLFDITKVTIVNNLAVIRISKEKNIFTYFWVTHWSIYRKYGYFYKKLNNNLGILSQILVMLNLQQNYLNFHVLNVHPKATKLTYVKKKIGLKSFDICTFVKRHFFGSRCQTSTSVFSVSLSCVSLSVYVVLFFDFLSASLTHEA